MNEYAFDLWASYMAGHLKGWRDQGGDMVEWAKVNRLTTKEVMGLTVKLHQIERAIANGDKGPNGFNTTTAHVVVWDHVQNELQTQLLEDVLGINAEAIGNDVKPGYTILSIWECEEKATSALVALKPLMRLS